jgi:hypothetical protein
MPQNALSATIGVSSGKGAPTQIDATGNIMVGKGLKSAFNVTAATVVKATPGRLAKISVLVAGAVGAAYDSITTSGNTAANEVFVIPATVGVYDIDVPCLTGIVIAPGAAQVCYVTYD